MKKAIFVLIILFVCTLSYSQNEVWSDPIAITDSVTDNTNPILLTIHGNAFVFWEKHMGENSTAIYMRNISELGDAIEILSMEHIHFRNPQFIKFSDYPDEPDTLFYLFFESDMISSGVFNIFYCKYSQDGHFTDPLALDISYTGCHHMRITDRNIVWERGGNIECTRLNGWEDDYYFSEISTIDEGNCFRPDIGVSTLLYEKQINNKTQIYRSIYDDDQWLTPEELYSEGDNTSVSIVYDLESHMADMAYLWESNQNGVWQIYGFDIWDEEIEVLDFISESPLQPSGLFYDIPIGETDNYLWLSHLAFVNSEEGNGDIYVNEAWWNYSNPINISNSTVIDSKPKLFYYYSSYVHHTVLIWESSRNEHQQLFMCSYEFTVQTEELSSKDPSITLSPNPMTQKAQMTFETLEHSPVCIDLIDIRGRHIDRLLQKSLDPGSHQLNIDLDQGLENGVYFIQFSTKSNLSRKKLILHR